MVKNYTIQPMLTVREVAEILHVHVNTVRRWSDQGIIKAFKINNRGDRRFNKHDIAKFISEMSGNHNIQLKNLLNKDNIKES